MTVTIKEIDSTVSELLLIHEGLNTDESKANQSKGWQTILEFLAKSHG